ncbi:uncharacterized protein RHO25_010020 [Cercospora beticola]|uniref:Uncharacterized protein n=2 Tax=Cercospora beticola TaxID=122368 RepID=A0ABZ0P0T4_CERBT|nr:hypothetical protein RHO25_010020 [Cercospora beticola]CAK1365169.1 unnamed protein product [Cercospora beticola]
MQGLRTYATAAKMATKELGLRLTWYLTGTIRPDAQVGMPPEIAAKALEDGFAMVPKLRKDIEDGKITSANIQFVFHNQFLCLLQAYLQGIVNIQRPHATLSTIATTNTESRGEPHATRKRDGTTDPEHYEIHYGKGDLKGSNRLGSAHLYMDGRLKFSKELLGTVLVALPGTKPQETNLLPAPASPSTEQEEAESSKKA